MNDLSVANSWQRRQRYDFSAEQPSCVRRFRPNSPHFRRREGVGARKNVGLNFAAHVNCANFAGELQSRLCTFGLPEKLHREEPIIPHAWLGRDSARVVARQEKIAHEGIVERVEGDRVRVRIVQTSACAACSARAMCASAEAKEKIIDVRCARAGELAPGQRVRVCGSASMGRRAVALAFLVPLALVVGWTVAALRLLGLSELAAAGGVAVVLAAYYAALAMAGRRIGRTFTFWIEPGGGAP